MTEAERVFLELALKNHEQSVYDEPTPLGDAARAVAQERTPPEAKEKFMVLRERAWAAELECSRFTETLPRSVVSAWYREWRAAKYPKQEGD